MTTLSNFKHTILSTPLGTIPQPSVQPCDNYTKESFENVVSTCAPFKIEQEVLPQIDPNNKFLNPEKRSQREFTHNNMVPFYGSSVKQNMLGTGVASIGTNGSDVKVGNSNETPFKARLNAFTGTSPTYRHKREVANMFSPMEQQTGWVNGKPLIRPDLDRYKQSIWNRHGEKPTEPIQVGPGLNLDPRVAAAGGHHQFTRILPNNVSDYKANQLPGRVAGEKWVYSNKPTATFSEGITQRKPPTFWEQDKRPVFQNRAPVSAPSGDLMGVSQVILKNPTNRQRMNYGFGQTN